MYKIYKNNKIVGIITDDNTKEFKVYGVKNGVAKDFKVVQSNGEEVVKWDETVQKFIPKKWITYQYTNFHQKRYLTYITVLSDFHDEEYEFFINGVPSGKGTISDPNNDTPLTRTIEHTILSPIGLYAGKPVNLELKWTKKDGETEVIYSKTFHAHMDKKIEEFPILKREVEVNHYRILFDVERYYLSELNLEVSITDDSNQEEITNNGYGTNEISFQGNYGHTYTIKYRIVDTSAMMRRTSDWFELKAVYPDEALLDVSNPRWKKLAPTICHVYWDNPYQDNETLYQVNWSNHGIGVTRVADNFPYNDIVIDELTEGKMNYVPIRAVRYVDGVKCIGRSYSAFVDLR